MATEIALRCQHRYIGGFGRCCTQKAVGALVATRNGKTSTVKNLCADHAFVELMLYKDKCRHDGHEYSLNTR